MVHKEEIKYWAEHPEGTRVWQKTNDKNSKWELSTFPKWHQTFRYIVDNEWAELRKAQADGEQLEHQISWNDWENDILNYEKIERTLPEYWRIKPSKPVCEYQWIYKIPTDEDDLYHLSTYYFTDEMDFAKTYPYGSKSKTRYIPIEPYLPSKRRRK